MAKNYYSPYFSSYLLHPVIGLQKHFFSFLSPKRFLTLRHSFSFPSPDSFHLLK